MKCMNQVRNLDKDEKVLNWRERTALIQDQCRHSSTVAIKSIAKKFWTPKLFLRATVT